jgi:hypothetical protein
MPRQPLAAVLLIVAVLGAFAAYTAPSEHLYANRGWDAPSSDERAELD